MQRTCAKISLAFLLIIFASGSAPAEELQTIMLKDGSRIIGKIVSVQDNFYTIETPNLGKLYIRENQITSIVNSTAPIQQNPTQLPPSPAGHSAVSPRERGMDKIQIQNQVEQMQGQLLSDQQFMGEMQEMLNDEEIKTLLTDPEVMNAVMTYDERTIQNNPKIQRLLQNPKFQKLMGLMQRKYSSGAVPPPPTLPRPEAIRR